MPALLTSAWFLLLCQFKLTVKFLKESHCVLLTSMVQYELYSEIGKPLPLTTRVLYF